MIMWLNQYSLVYYWRASVLCYVVLIKRLKMKWRSASSKQEGRRKPAFVVTGGQDQREYGGSCTNPFGKARGALRAYGAW